MFAFAKVEYPNYLVFFGCTLKKATQCPPLRNCAWEMPLESCAELAFDFLSLQAETGINILFGSNCSCSLRRSGFLISRGA